MDMRFEPKITTNSEDRKAISNTILEEFKDKFSTSLLNIGHIEMGEKFQGICYVSGMRMIRNASDKEKYDGRFDLIDGSGRRFNATYWGMSEKFNTHNSLAYVEGVFYTVGNINNPRKVYRLDKITQSTLDIPKHVFFKNIPELDEYRNAVNKELDKLINPEYKALLEKLKEKDIIRTLETVPFDNINYIELGSRLKVYMTILMDAVNFHKIYNLNFDLLRIGTLLSLWDPNVILSNKKGRDIDLKYRFHAEEVLYKTNMSLETKIALMSFIKMDNSTVESMFVKNSIEKYKELLKTIDTIQEKSGDLIM